MRCRAARGFGATAWACAWVWALATPGKTVAQVESTARVQLIASTDSASLVDFSREARAALGEGFRFHTERDGGWFKLQLGFASFADASAALPDIRRRGYPDAWIVAPARVERREPPGSSAGASGSADRLSHNRPATADSIVAMALPVAAPRRSPDVVDVGLYLARAPLRDQHVYAVTLREPPGTADDNASAERIPDGQFEVRATVAGRAETNIDHDQDYSRAWGLIAGAGARYIYDGDETAFEVSYEVARHEYPDAPKWTRVGHVGRASVERELGDDLKFEISAEASFGGSTEDRELANVFTVRPRLEWELDERSEFRLSSAFRLKRYPGEPERNATAPYVELEFRRRLWGEARLAFSTRGGIKHTPTPRRRYRRFTQEADLEMPFAGGLLELGLKFRLKSYDERMIETLDGDDELRRDRRLRPRASWLRPIDTRLSLFLEYDFESRVSNDPDKVFDAHALVAAIWVRIH